MTSDPELMEYREAVLTLMTDGVAVVTLAACILVMLIAALVVRHW